MPAKRVVVLAGVSGFLWGWTGHTVPSVWDALPSYLPLPSGARAGDFAPCYATSDPASGLGVTAITVDPERPERESQRGPRRRTRH